MKVSRFNELEMILIKNNWNVFTYDYAYHSVRMVNNPECIMRIELEPTGCTISYSPDYDNSEKHELTLKQYYIMLTFFQHSVRIAGRQPKTIEL